jgi:hypothetical protein
MAIKQTSINTNSRVLTIICAISTAAGADLALSPFCLAMP